MGERIGNWLGMPAGRRFYPLDPRADEVRIEDIAHSLANTCRFGGRCEPFYSVAQHCCWVSEQVERFVPHLALAALLHDAAEAYIGDIVLPLKAHMFCAPDERSPEPIDRTESRIMRAIHDAFGLEWPLLPAVRGVIKTADAVALATEARDLMGDPKWPGLTTPDRGVLVPWTPQQAKGHFLDRFNRLMAREAQAS